ncbi:fimbrial protein [Enterobacter asburiae]|uniref:fimbrial protein n=1 Tax=Enterobacter asburiae TaxID=61645 RepID=UPI0020056FE2|nr:fimbrial protein [Enterobacter asburiae]MCK6667982.1 fimbrial protein [Enterobacter asburiae]HDT1287318.1 fimbrial protein [Enterobacter asburiae]
MKKHMFAVVMASIMASATCAQAASTTTTVNGGNIKFMGSVVDAPCAVALESEDQVVHIDQITLKSLGAKDAVSGQSKPFYVTLTNCDVSTYTNAAISFSGQSDAVTAGALANTAGSGGATGVALRLFGPDGKAMDVNSGTASDTIPLSKGDNTIPMSVDYLTTGDEPTAGAVEAVATFQIIYS